MAGIALQHPRGVLVAAHRAGRTTTVHRRRPDAAHGAGRPPRPGAAAGAPTRPAAGNGVGVAERDPRARAVCRADSRCATSRPPGRCRSAATGTTSSTSTTAASRMIVGDCVGHGLAAATVMGQLRSACRALLLRAPQPRAPHWRRWTGSPPRLPGAQCTTAFCAVLESGHR